MGNLTPDDDDWYPQFKKLKAQEMESKAKCKSVAEMLETHSALAEIQQGSEELQIQEDLKTLQAFISELNSTKHEMKDV